MRTTLKREISLVGAGLHSGRPARLVLRPTDAGGIRFHRVDIRDRDNVIPARWDAVSDTTLCTRLTNAAGVSISTVEHLMAAFAGTGVTDAVVDIDGPEVPIMDGSAVRFSAEIFKAGLRPLEVPARAIRILRPVRVDENGASAELRPADGFSIDFAIDFADAAIGRQEKTLDMANGAFARELADCRTFCRRADVDAMQAAGLALGGSLDNAVVVEGDRVLNSGGLRRRDEFVRHKMLDALGDLALAGAPIIGAYSGVKAGHGVTNQLLRALFADLDAFEVVPLDAEAAASLPGAGAVLSDLREAV